MRANAYFSDGPWTLRFVDGSSSMHEWSVLTSHHWYDFSVSDEHFERRFAGRMENGRPGFSDPAI